MKLQSNELASAPDTREIWSFFSGAMGLDLGLELSGLHTTLAVENDKNCCNTIRKNRPSLTVIERSVSELTAEDLRLARGGYTGEVFLMVGGPPCQSFSSGGNRSGLTDPRGNLIYEYMRLINEVRPRYFVFENVANIVTAALRHRPISERPGKKWNLSSYQSNNERNVDGARPLDKDEMAGSAIRQILNDYLAIGYHIHFAVVDAADYGAPQRRLRFVMLGARDNFIPPTIPAPKYGPSPLKPFRTLRDAIADLESDPGDHSVYTEDVAKYFRLVPEGKNWRSLPLLLQKEAMGSSFEAGGGKTGFYRRLGWESPAPTITGAANRKASALCHPSQTRPLSTRECARIQGFPDDWELTGSMAARYKQIGNAVPVHLGRALGESILKVDQSTLDESHFFSVPCATSQLTLAQDRLKASARNKVTKTNKTLSLFEDA
ncbi:DNA cytosine methyltransferase [Pseudomonas sp. 51_B]|uniref:DNA cytosine methyltransferase n=1 Tax=Pseudomonas sp. 51_B TaxID=2813573 RepID=UPI001A9FD0A0|nr:DNA cytosine methyltransferase [Pseudomonas sp. 51_B]